MSPKSRSTVDQCSTGSFVDVIAQAYVDGGMALSEARDTIICRCLEAGDASAFSYWVLNGYQPSDLVMRMLAYMVAEDVPSTIIEHAPFALVPKSRKPGRKGKREDPLVTMRNELLAIGVDSRIAPGGYAAAVEETAALVSLGEKGKDGRALKYETARKAYDSKLGKGSSHGKK